MARRHEGLDTSGSNWEGEGVGGPRWSPNSPTLPFQTAIWPSGTAELEPLSSNSLSQLPLFALALFPCPKFSEEPLNASGLGNKEKGWVLCHFGKRKRFSLLIGWGGRQPREKEETTLLIGWRRRWDLGLRSGQSKMSGSHSIKGQIWMSGWDLISRVIDGRFRFDHQEYMNMWWRLNHKGNAWVVQILTKGT